LSKKFELGPVYTREQGPVSNNKNISISFNAVFSQVQVKNGFTDPAKTKYYFEKFKANRD